MSDTQAEDQRAQIRAEKIVREHGSTDCHGHFVPDLPFCSCAPDGQPLCDSCGKLRDAIAAELSRLSRVEQALRAVVQNFANPENWSDEVGCLQWVGKRHALEYANTMLKAPSASPEAQPEEGR